MAFSLKEKLNLDELYSNFSGFNSQERAFAVGGVVLALLIIVVLPISCASSKLTKMEKQIVNHESDVSKIVEKISEYQTLEQQLKAIEGQNKDANVKLSSIIDNLTNKMGIAVDSMKERENPGDDSYKEMLIEVRVSKTTLDQLVELLYNVESYRTAKLKVTSLKLRPRYEDKRLLDATFEAATIVLLK